MDTPQKKTSSSNIEITYYTDPLCCWSWGFEPQWRRLRYEYEGQISWRYYMGGLLPDWTRYNDPMNAINKPLQMGPLWREAAFITGMKISDTIWFHDPPKSSYPACIAVKCAALQSPAAEDSLLRQLREAVMINGVNISRIEVIVELANNNPNIDFDLFKKDFTSEKGQEAFRTDLQLARYNNIGRFPTLVIETKGKNGLIMTGYRPYEVFLQAIKQLLPDIQPTRTAKIQEEYKNYWKNPQEKEIQEALSGVNT